MTPRRIALYTLLVLAALFSVRNIYLIKQLEIPNIDTPFPWTHVDSTPVWVGSRMILHHQNPYTPQGARNIQIAYYQRPLTPTDLRMPGMNPEVFAYPPQTAFVCLWMALLPWKAASIVHFTLSIFLVAFSAIVWLRFLDIRRKDLIAVPCLMACWPTLWGIRIENLSMLVIPVIAIACWCYLRQKFVLAGILLALTTVKPQLSAILILWLLVISIRDRRWSFLGSLAATGLALAALSEIWLPGCFRAWLGILREYQATTQMHHPFRLLVPVLAILSLVALYRIRNDFRMSVVLVLALTATAMPINTFTVYNFIILMPAACLIFMGKTPEDFVAKCFLVMEFVVPFAYYRFPRVNELMPYVVCFAMIARILFSGDRTPAPRFAGTLPASAPRTAP